MSDFEKFKAAIYGQESGNGSVDTSQPNYAGARGKGQILESTFKGLQRNGKVPADYQWSNPAHNEFAAEAYMKEAWEATGGDPRRAGAYYYGGPKAVANGRIVLFGDKKNPKAPTTVEYADSIAARMGLAPGKPTPVAKAVRSYTAAEFMASVPDDRFKREAATFASALKEELRPTVGERLSAAISGNQDQRISDILSNWRMEFPRDPSFVMPKDEFIGLETDKVVARLKAGSQAEYDHIKAEQEKDDARAKVLMADGVGSGLAIGLAGELLAVSTWVAPWAAARALGGRSVAAAIQGRQGAAIGAALVENAVAGTAVELGLQTAEGHYDMANLMLAATADMIAGAAQAASVVRGARLSGAAAGVIEREMALLSKVDNTLGTQASPELRAAEYQRLRSEELKKPLVESASPVAKERLLMDRPDDDLMDTPASADRDVAGTYPVPEVKAPRFNTLEEVDAAFEQQVRFENPNLGQARVAAAANPSDPRGFNRYINTITEGEVAGYLEAASLPKGFHATQALRSDPSLAKLLPTMEALVKQYMPPNATVIFGRGQPETGTAGVITSVNNVHVIGVKSNGLRVQHTTMHELGHAVFHQWAKKAPPELLDRLNAEYLNFVNLAAAGDQRAMDLRFAGTSGRVDEALETTNYIINRDEWFAENFVKHVQKRVLNGGSGLPKGVVDQLLVGLKRMFEMFIKAKRQGVIEPAASVEEFAKAVLDRSMGNRNAAMGELATGQALQADAAAKAADSANAFLTSPVALKYGLTLLPVGTSAERADAKAILNLYTKADAWAVKNPMDAAWVKRADQLIDNSLLPAASTGLRLLKSPNPVARMIASELLEDASGVAGSRKSTAAISKYTHERKFMGNTLNDMHNAYELWAAQRGGNMLTELTDKGAMRARFDYAVASEIEARRVQQSQSVSDDPYVKVAADSLQGAYDRIRSSQIANKTLGFQALGDTSLGYMPHKISPSKWMSLDTNKRQVVHSALVDQFVTIEGWDISFSDALAARYLQRVQARATGGHDSPIGGASSGSAEIIEDALLSMGMSTDEVRKNMQRFNRGAATWTKGRLDLDLNKTYEVNGEEFKLLDVFETDQVALLRSQAGRASGEVALARHGVYGKPGLAVIRKALAEGGGSVRADAATFNRELDAFDQVAAEFLNAPFGTAEPKWMENARVLNSVVRLGGIVFNQFAEFVNGVTHVGLERTLSGVASMGRLRKEIKDLAAGKAVDNSLLGSIERIGGAEFGTDAYKIVMPFDAPDHAYPTYGKDTLGSLDRLLRGASYAQAKLSLWRTVHSVQQRAFAEQIVAKVARYSVDGKEDVALRQFGISPELQAAIKADGVARWDASGSLVEFDVTNLQSAELREDLIQAVHRGVSQIIQGTFIGETGKWAHEGYLKMLTQFRTFSLTSMEKQWARQRNSRGVAQSLGILLGSAFAVTPVYMARVYAQSVGREDREEFLESRLAPEVIARQTLNYMAMSGLAGDFLDAAATLAPDSLGLKAITGNRSGSDTEFIGNVIAPSLSLVDDGWKALQNLDDPQRLAKLLPGSRLPFVLPAINALGD